MVNQKEWESEVRKIYRKIKSHKKSYTIIIDRISVVIFPNVFSPKYFTDSVWFARILPEIVKKKNLLEIGTGTGIVALFAALGGAKITATDINADATANAAYNFKKHKIPVKTFTGDMYTPLPKNSRFDFIFWNHPFNRGENCKENILLKSGFDFHYESLEKYISGAHLHLKPRGKLLLGTGNFATLSEIKRIVSRNNYAMRLLRRTKLPLSEGSKISNEYHIYRLFRLGR